MEKKESENLFSMKVEGNSLIQPKNGNLLIYSFNHHYNFNVYNKKTFHKILQIDLYENFFKEKGKEEKNKNEKENNKHFIDYYNKYRFNKLSIKEIEDNLLLIGNMTFLIEVKLYEKSFDIREVKQLQDIIVDINELSDKRLIVITRVKL